MRDKKPYIEQKIKRSYFSIINKSLYKTMHKSNFIDRGHYFGHYK